jgi:dihydropteroate synthase
MLPHLANLSVRLSDLLQAPRLMGIVNITPNSFSDTGAHQTPAAAIAHAQLLIQQGATILDLGAEASSFFRPGVTPVDPSEQIRRLIPVITGLASQNEVLISIDTRSAEVARAAILAGAHIINDISAGTHDSGMLATVAELGVPIVLMHIAARYPRDPAEDVPDICGATAEYLRQRAGSAVAEGISPSRIWLDPGIGFGKTARDNTTLALEFPLRDDLPFPVVLGVSRKRFLASPEFSAGAAIVRPSAAWSKLATHERDRATAAVIRYHAARPFRPLGLIHRVHNVALAAAAIGFPG